MAYVSVNTQHGWSYELHETAQEAVAHLLHEVGSDYANDFWASDDGQSIIQSDSSCLDFGLYIFPSEEAALKDLHDMDFEALPHALRVLADAIETFYAEG